MSTDQQTESGTLRALRVVAATEGISFVVLLVCSVLKRTTDVNLVPVMGPVHGTLFLLLVGLVLVERETLRWSGRFTLLMLTVGSPGAHFAVHASRPAPGGSHGSGSLST